MVSVNGSPTHNLLLNFERKCRVSIWQDFILVTITQKLHCGFLFGKGAMMEPIGRILPPLSSS